MNHRTGKTLGVHHVGLTVVDIQCTGSFFIDVLGFNAVGERPAYPAIFLSDGQVLITLWQAVSPSEAHPFDRHHQIGLHHLALATGHLDELYSQLITRADVDIEFPPEMLGGSSKRHMMCNIPGGIRLELIET